MTAYAIETPAMTHILESLEAKKAREGMRIGRFMDEEFEVELTAGDVYESLCERVAQARTRALMGERAEALDILQSASLEYDRFREALQGLPLHSLEHDFTITRQILCAEHSRPASRPEELPAELKPRVRKRASKAA